MHAAESVEPPPTTSQHDELVGFRSVLAIVGGTLIGVGPFLDPLTGVLLITGAAVLILYAVVVRDVPEMSRPLSQVSKAVSWVALGSGSVVFVSRMMRLDLFDGSSSWVVATAFVIILLLASVGVFRTSNASQSRWFMVFMLAFLAVDLAVIVATHSANIAVPNVDLTYIQVEGVDALVSGENPYALMLPDYFSPPGGRSYYGADSVVGGIRQFGFIYPPASLLVITPFQLLFGDFRIAAALSLLAIAWMLARLGSSAQSRRVAVLFLLLTPTVLLTGLGFTEPIVMVAGLGVMLTYERRTALTPYLFGLFVALKQYVVIASPVYLLLVDRPWTLRVVASHALKSLAVVVALTVPFVIWAPEPFIESVFLVQMDFVLHRDAITLPAQALAIFGSVPSALPTILSLVGAGGGIAISLRFGPQGRQGYALASALVFVAFFLFSRGAALPNYYMVVIAFVFAAAAVDDSGSRTNEAESSPNTV